MGHLKRTCKDAFSVAGAVQSPARELQFWEDDFVWEAQYFRDMEYHGMVKSQNALARGRQLCTELSIIEGSLAEFLRV